MPLKNPKAMILSAKQNKKGIGAFNVLNLEMIKAVIEAAEEADRPVILQISTGAMKWASFNLIVPAVLTAAREAKVDVAVHLDHASDLALIQKAIKAGFSSIMYDGSHEKYDLNVKNSNLVKKMIGTKDIALEVEIGKVGGKEDDVYAENSDFVDLDTAIDFYNDIQPTLLAVGFGTAHGIYKGPINLDFDIIRNCSQNLDVPLVMHGSSGVPFTDIKKAINAGITKINVGTDLLIANFQAIRNYLTNNPDEYNIRKINQAGIDAIKTKVKEYLKLFDNN